MSPLGASIATRMTPDPVVVDPDDEVDVAETVMRLGRANEWPVACGRSLLGLVTIGDVLAERAGERAGDREPLTCARVMSAAPIIAHPTSSLAHAARDMQVHHLSCLPVVADGELVGLVTLTDLVELAVEQLEREALHYGKLPIVAHLMTRGPTTVGPDDTLAVAQALMETMRVRHLPVRTDDRLVGILAQRDLVWALRAFARRASEVLVRDIMTSHPKTTTPEGDAAYAGRMLVHHGVGALPVVRGDRLIGILSKRDYLRYLVSIAPSQHEWS